MLTHWVQTVRTVLGNELGVRGLATMLVKASISWGLRTLVSAIAEWL